MISEDIKNLEKFYNFPQIPNVNIGLANSDAGKHFIENIETNIEVIGFIYVPDYIMCGVVEI